MLEDFEPAKLDDTTEIEQIKPRNTANRYLSKIYTNISDLKNDENTDDIYYDKELDDTPYDILKLYDKEKKSMDEKLFKESDETKLVPLLPEKLSDSYISKEFPGSAGKKNKNSLGNFCINLHNIYCLFKYVPRSLQIKIRGNVPKTIW